MSAQQANAGIACPDDCVQIVVNVAGSDLFFGINAPKNVKVNNKPFRISGNFKFFCHGQILSTAQTFGFYEKLFSLDNTVLAIPAKMFAASNVPLRDIAKMFHEKSHLAATEELYQRMSITPNPMKKILNKMNH